MPNNELRLLAPDGGRVILDQLMETIHPNLPPKLCNYFDMIGGKITSG
jgi:hypothetical protein